MRALIKADCSPKDLANVPAHLRGALDDLPPIDNPLDIINHYLQGIQSDRGEMESNITDDPCKATSPTITRTGMVRTILQHSSQA